MSSRACHRCIAKKRKCDHRLPTCDSCVKAREDCTYPPPRQRRGPMQGLTKVLEERIDEYERALWYLLGQAGVMTLLQQQASLAGADATLPPAPLSDLERDDRREMWKDNELKTMGDLLKLRGRLGRESGSPSQCAHRDIQSHMLAPISETLPQQTIPSLPSITHQDGPPELPSHPGPSTAAGVDDAWPIIAHASSFLPGGLQDTLRQSTNAAGVFPDWSSPLFAPQPKKKTTTVRKRKRDPLNRDDVFW